jgi:spermidine synthase
MNILKNRIKEQIYNNEFSLELIKHEEIFYKIYEKCGSTFSRKIGSYLFDGKKYEYHIGMYNKQKLLYDTVKNAKTILEIGTYMGHSLLLMLIANPSLKVTCIDIDSTFSKPATDFLKETFPTSDITFIHGNSLDVLPLLTEKFDFFHIDGKHNNKMITQEFNICKTLRSDDIMNVIFDDSETCQPLLENIRNQYEVIADITPNSDWYNTLMKIRI